MSGKLKVGSDDLAVAFVRGYLLFAGNLPTKLADASASGMVMNAKSCGHKAARPGTASSQGRRMLKNNLENLELDRLENESRKLVAERKKLLAEEKKLNRETNLYPLAVIAGVVTAITAVAGVFFKF
jgi:hypothetical protein